MRKSELAAMTPEQRAERLRAQRREAQRRFRDRHRDEVNAKRREQYVEKAKARLEEQKERHLNGIPAVYLRGKQQ